MKRILTATVAIAGVMAAAGCTANEPPAAQALEFKVDSSLRPAIAQVDPLEGGAIARPVGALAMPDGTIADLVLDEVILHARDAAELESFLSRWNGKVMDSFEPDAEGQDHLVQVDLSKTDPGALTGDLLATQPGYGGTHRVSDERVLRLLALAASEWKRGTEVVIDWLAEESSIETGVAHEAGDITQDGAPKNVFDWSYMRAGGALDTGVGAAWQLLAAHGKLTPRVKYMVVDGGFNTNPDFPDTSRIRKADWGAKNPVDCTNGTPCPYHGTDVVLAAMAKVDNEYGTAGPAGPVVAELVAVGNGTDYWARMRRIEAVAEDEHPDIVNLSFTRSVDVGTWHAKTWTDRRMKHVRDTGALIVAAAGNNGRTVDSDTLYLPCESTHVMCVGGFDSDATVHSGSNYGQGDSASSVEIYGPMCVRTINDAIRPYLDFTTKNTCGTSVASPFVGGVAALVMAADPNLSAGQVRAILNETANVGGLGAKVTGSQRRINALQAVAKALGVAVGNPSVTIQTPSPGKEFSVGHWVDLKGTAKDFMGRNVAISWSSDRDGALGNGSTTSVPPLSAGTHVITASATDSTGRTGTATVTVEMVDNPPTVKIVSPPAPFNVWEDTDIPLVGTSTDPDTYSAVPDDQTGWEVRRNGTLVFEANGHSKTLPGNKVLPGAYTVKFTAAGVTRERSFTVMDVPAGQTKPAATITKPGQSLSLGAYNGQPKTIEFAGSGTDAQDGTVSGMRFKWTATNGTTTKTLCQGSNVPGSGGGGIIVAPKSCKTFTAQLGLGPGDMAVSTWVITLNVYDNSGLVGSDSVEIEIYYVTG